jgi:Ketopantoate reductase
MRILIYGAGVIGSLYAALLGEAGFEVTVYARGNRLTQLQRNGLKYINSNQVKTAKVKIIDKLVSDDKYHYIFLTVRQEQVKAALMELRGNKSPNIVTMVNSIEPYTEWEKICGKGRILPAFPGAGGSIMDGVLDASLTPWMIQPTTFGEIDGNKTKREITLAHIFKKCHIPYQIVPDMHNWQVSHLGMVVPIADAYYKSDEPAMVYKNKRIMDITARSMKQNFMLLSTRGMLSPFKFNLLIICPTWVLSLALTYLYKSDFGNKFMYQHSMKSPQEMRDLHHQFYAYRKELSGDKR